MTSISAFQNSEAIIRKVLTSSRNIALVGASPKPERPSNYVMKFLLDKGYNVYPINPGLEGQELYGQMVYGTLADIPEQIDMVDIFRASSAVPAIVDEAIAIGGIKTIWMQQGVVNEEAAETAKAAGMDVVMGEFNNTLSCAVGSPKEITNIIVISFVKMHVRRFTFLYWVFQVLARLASCNILAKKKIFLSFTTS
jgi:predicted CoA-binding protein